MWLGEGGRGEGEEEEAAEPAEEHFPLSGSVQTSFRLIPLHLESHILFRF